MVRPGPLDRLVRHDVLHRSGLAFAGANAWLTGDRRAPREVVLTADQIAVLDLRDTEMVVLSACETGLGVTRAAEGILGVAVGVCGGGRPEPADRLWKVPDAETREFMEHLYRLVTGGVPRAAQCTLPWSSSVGGTPTRTFSAFALEGDTGPLP